MSPSDFAKVICGINGEPAFPLPEGGVVLAAGAITHQPASNPYRIVLRAVPKVIGGQDVMEFVVHDEIWTVKSIADVGGQYAGRWAVGPSGFGHGDYFYPFAPNAEPVKEFIRAYARWVERVMRDLDAGYPDNIARRIQEQESMEAYKTGEYILLQDRIEELRKQQ